MKACNRVRRLAVRCDTTRAPTCTWRCGEGCEGSEGCEGCEGVKAGVRLRCDRSPGLQADLLLGGSWGWVLDLDGKDHAKGRAGSSRRGGARARSPRWVSPLQSTGASPGRRAAAARPARPRLRERGLHQPVPSAPCRPSDPSFPPVASGLLQPGQDLLRARTPVRGTEPHPSPRWTSGLPCLPPGGTPAMEGARQRGAGGYFLVTPLTAQPRLGPLEAGDLTPPPGCRHIPEIWHVQTSVRSRVVPYYQGLFRQICSEL